jgi:outer membrane protein TolC
LFTWPLWDAGGLYKSRLVQARLSARLAADSALVVRRQAELEWARATEQLEDYYNVVALRTRGVPVARDSYLQAQSLYRGGIGTALDVVAAYTSWVDAQIAEADAVRDYRQTEAQLLRWGTP